MRNAFVAGSLALAGTLVLPPIGVALAQPTPVTTPMPTWRWADRAPRVTLVSAVEDQGGFLAVGSQGELLQLRDGAWRLLPVPGRVALQSLWRSPDGEIFAAGAREVMLHRTSQGEWTREVIPRPERGVYRGWTQVAGRSARDVWATTGLRLYHRDGAHWTSIPLPAGIELTRIRTTARGTYAGTTSGQVLELRASPASARVIATVPSRAGILDLWVDSPRNITVSVNGSGGVVRYDGRRWTVEAVESNSRVRQFAQGDTPVLLTDTAVVVTTTPGWTRYPYEGPGLIAATLSGSTVHALDRNGALVTLTPNGFDVQPAPEVDGTLCHDTTDAEVLTANFLWHLSPAGAHTEPYAAAPEECRRRTPRDLRARFAAEADASGTTAEEQPPPLQVRAAFSRPGERIVLADDPVRLLRETLPGHSRTDLADPWTIASWPGEPIFVGGLPDANAEIWIGGSNYLVRASAGHFERFYLGVERENAALRGIANAGTELFAYGQDWQVLHWTGTLWNPEGTPRRGASDVSTVAGHAALLQSRAVTVRNDAGRFVDVRSDGSLRAGLEGLEFGSVDALWGRSSNDAYAVSGSLLFHFDGHGWTRVRTFSNEDFEALSGAGDNVYTVGLRGRIVAAHGPQVQPEIAGTRADLYAVLARGTGDEVFAAGENVILHRSAQGWSREYPTDGDRASLEAPPGAVEFRAVFEFGGRLYAMTSSGHVLVRGDQGWSPMGEGDVLHGFSTLIPQDGEAEPYPHYQPEGPVSGGPSLTDSDSSGYYSGDNDGGDYDSEDGSDPDLRDPNARRRAEAISPCGVLLPRPDALLVLSCRNDEIERFEGGQWTTIHLPASVGMTGGACIPGGECYVFTHKGTLVGEGL